MITVNLFRHTGVFLMNVEIPIGLDFNSIIIMVKGRYFVYKNGSFTETPCITGTT